jgi:hypothetical protein
VITQATLSIPWKVFESVACEVHCWKTMEVFTMPKKSTLAGADLQLPLPSPARALDRVSTQRARAIMNVKRMRPGMVYEADASYGGKWIAVWAGVNPKSRSENVWDILYQQAS